MGSGNKTELMIQEQCDGDKMKNSEINKLVKNLWFKTALEDCKPSPLLKIMADCIKPNPVWRWWKFWVKKTIYVEPEDKGETVRMAAKE